MALELQGIKCLYQVHPVYLDHRLLHRGYPLPLSDVRGVLMIADLVLLSSLLLVIIQEVNFEGILDFDVRLLGLLLGRVIYRGVSLFRNIL